MEVEKEQFEKILAVFKFNSAEKVERYTRQVSITSSYADNFYSSAWKVLIK